MKKYIFCLLISCLVGLTAKAALPAQPLLVKPGQWTSPLKSGAATGGYSADPLSLVDIKTERIGQSEKIMLSYGDMQGKAMRGEPGFFHVSVDRGGRRISIDLADVTRTAVDPDELRKRFKGSAFVAKTDMTMDPHDGSTNITLLMKLPVSVAVRTDAAVDGQLAIEIKAQTLGAK